MASDPRASAIDLSHKAETVEREVDDFIMSAGCKRIGGRRNPPRITGRIGNRGGSPKITPFSACDKLPHSFPPLLRKFNSSASAL
jgi:hypothetical protein